MNKKEYMSMREVLKRIWWIRSFATLRKWVERDHNTSNFLQSIRVGQGRGTRYYFKKEIVEEYVRKFEKGELFQSIPDPSDNS